MAGLIKRDAKEIERVDTFDRLDRLFDEWMKVLPFRRPVLFDRDSSDDMIRVDEIRTNGDLVIRAELPGIDPDKDVDLTVHDGVIDLRAERREEQRSEDEGYVRRELRYGSFARTLPLPAGTSESDIKAEYKDGILEIRVPMPEAPQGTKVPISKS